MGINLLQITIWRILFRLYVFRFCTFFLKQSCIVCSFVFLGSYVYSCHIRLILLWFYCPKYIIWMYFSLVNYNQHSSPIRLQFISFLMFFLSRNIFDCERKVYKTNRNRNPFIAAKLIYIQTHYTFHHKTYLPVAIDQKKKKKNQNIYIGIYKYNCRALWKTNNIKL